jgi:hypothetical protein
MFPQTREKPCAIRPVLIPPFGGRVNDWPHASNDCIHVLVYGGGVNSRVPHHASTGANARYREKRASVSPQKRALQIILLILLALVLWFGVRAAIVAYNLTAAQDLVAELQTEASAGDLDAAAETIDSLQSHIGSAAAGTADPTWRLAEVIPALGPNLHAVRMLAESSDDIVNELASPAIHIAASFDLSTKDPITGAFDLTPLTEAKVVAADAGPVLNESMARIDSVDSSKTLGPVRDAVDQIGGAIAQAVPIAESAEPIVNLISAAMGQDGPRNYLLAFQNNAESTALGGSAASYTLMHTDNGAVSIADQANSGDFEEGVPVDVPVDQSALDLYGTYLVDHVNTSTSRPDFPTAASVMQGFWARDRGSAVDGVISLDPIALALMLDATGDITLASGDVLTSDNAVDLLTNGVYMRFPNNEDQPLADAFFAQAAATVVGKVMGGEFDIPKMVTAITTGVDQGDIMMWSSNVDEQAALDGFRIQGKMPISNDKETLVGVYYRDTSASKMDYYLQTSSSTSSDVCTGVATPTFSTTVRLTSTLTEEQAQTLPEYVASRDWGTTKFRTEVFVYGPVGSTVAGTTVNEEGLETGVTAGVPSDLGRPVATFFAYLQPGETTAVNVTFVGAEGTYGPLAVRGTPMINPTNTVIEETAVCG